MDRVSGAATPSPCQVKRTIVIGLGNVLMSDEGIGVLLVRRLAGRAAEFPDAEFVDAGSAGMKLLHLVANRERAILVDCARMGCRPGEMRAFGTDDACSCKVLAGLSLHEGDLLSILGLSRRLGECPREVVIFGIEPAAVEQGTELSPSLAARLDEYSARIAEEIGPCTNSR